MSVDSLVKASTPEPLGRPGGPGLWHHKGLMLPAYVQHIARDLIEKRGMDRSRAIATAVAAIKRWAAGGGHVDAGTRAAAQKALAEWEAKRAASKGKHLSNGGSVDSIDLATLTTKARNKLPASKFALPGSKSYPVPDKAHAANAKARAAQMLKAGKITQAQYDKICAMANKVLGKSSKSDMSNALAGLDPEHKVRVLELAASNTKMRGHLRAKHGMKVPGATAAAGMAKLHGYLHRKGGADHDPDDMGM